MQAASDFDIGDAGDSRLHGHEFGFAIAQNKNSLNIGLYARCAFAIRGGQRDIAAIAVFGLVQFFLRPLGERLNRHGENVLLLRRLNLGREREAGTKRFRADCRE